VPVEGGDERSSATSMLTHNDLKKGVQFILNKEPYEVLDSSFIFKGRGSSTVQAKIKNLITGNIITKTFRPDEEFEEVEISKVKAKFLYQHRDNFVFSEADNPAKRFELTTSQIGDSRIFLKPAQIVEGIIFQDRVINISLPIKINLKVIEAPPGLKGDRAQAGNKLITLETGAKINAPLFIKEGDIVEVNTETGEYVRRVE